MGSPTGDLGRPVRRKPYQPVVQAGLATPRSRTSAALPETMSAKPARCKGGCVNRTNSDSALTRLPNGFPRAHHKREDVGVPEIDAVAPQAVHNLSAVERLVVEQVREGIVDAASHRHIVGARRKGDFVVECPCAVHELLDLPVERRAFGPPIVGIVERRCVHRDGKALGVGGSAKPVHPQAVHHENMVDLDEYIAGEFAEMAREDAVQLPVEYGIILRQYGKVPGASHRAYSNTGAVPPVLSSSDRVIPLNSSSRACMMRCVQSRSSISSMMSAV